MTKEIKTHRAKKSLGQNFLKSIPALNAIIKAGEISKKDMVLEIGPGKGALTAKLLEHAGLVVAVEKDKELFHLLEEKFAKEIKNKSFILIEDDILDFNIQKIEKSFEYKNYKIIANIPYNITGAILKKFLTDKKQPERMILMVQHEVAKRIVSTKESILSISVKAYGEPKLVMKVPARYFSPAPKVDSAIIAIKNISRANFEKNGVNEEKFWEIVKNGFAHKRKKLSGNLKNTILAEKLLESGFKEKRAEDLSLSDWKILAKN